VDRTKLTRNALVVLGMLAAMIGVGVLIDRGGFFQTCQRYCWLKTMMEALFGATLTTILHSALWFVISAAFHYSALRVRKISN